MKPTMKFLAVLIFACCAVLGTAALAQDKPNILIIWGDDIGWLNISAYSDGMMGYRTPNIHQIAGRDPLH